MKDDRWLELEFNALRAELLALGQAERSAVKFYIPAASTVYAVPYILLQQPSAKVPQDQAVFLWTLCATVAGLLTLAMVQSLFWSVDGARRIGMYIKERIEPQTAGGLRWETILFGLYDQKQFTWPSESVTIAASTVLANLVAALAAGILFIDGPVSVMPVAAAGIVSAFALPALRRMGSPSQSRAAYAVRIAGLIATFRDTQAATVKMEVPSGPKVSISADEPVTPVVAEPLLPSGPNRLNIARKTKRNPKR
jgi:hypothetical protein